MKKQIQVAREAKFEGKFERKLEGKLAPTHVRGLSLFSLVVLAVREPHRDRILV